MTFFNLEPWENKFTRSPNLDWLIPHTIEKGSMFSIIGQPGSGKSFVATDLAVAVSTGTAWLGMEGFVPEAGPVVVISPEATNSAVRRIAEQFKFRGKENSQAQLLISDRALPVKQAARNSYAELEDLNPSLVLIDTWARATPGVNENSATDIGGIIYELDIMRKNCGTAVGVVHHTDKAGHQGRGTSALLGAIDTELVVRKLDDGNSVIINTKQKNAAQWPASIIFSISNSTVMEDVGHPNFLEWLPNS